MARQTEPTPVAKLGFAIALAAFVVVIALGFSRQTVSPTTPPTGDSPTAAVACGSVFSPEVEPLCDSTRSSRKNLMLAVGIPGVVLGLGIVVAASRKPSKGVGA
ncbi:MAG: hypothetical protein V3S62_08675 [Acidimicrobiia bacterium]